MKRDTKIVAGVVAAIPLFVLSAATLCTAAIASGASAKWRLLFRTLCHGMPARSFELFGAAMPICARCTGIYIGLFAGVLAALVLPWVEERVMRMWALVAAAPMAIDGITQLIGLRESTNALRIATGLVAAAVFSVWVVMVVEKADRPAVTVP